MVNVNVFRRGFEVNPNEASKTKAPDVKNEIAVAPTEGNNTSVEPLKIKGSGTKDDPYICDGFLMGGTLKFYMDLAAQLGHNIIVVEGGDGGGRTWTVSPTGAGC